jgi:hypothetical protein
VYHFRSTSSGGPCARLLPRRRLLLLSAAVLPSTRPSYFCYSCEGRRAAPRSRPKYFLLPWADWEVLRALEAGEQHPAAAAGGQCDLIGPVLNVLREEMKQYWAFLDSQSKIYVDCAQRNVPLVSPYGDPGPKADARYELWPQRNKE